MLHQAFIFHLPSHITYFIGTCKQYNRPAIQYNTRFVSPFIYFLDNAYIYQLVHRHSTLTWHHFCQKIWGNLLFSSSFCLKVLIAGPRSSSGQPTLTFYLSEMSATFSFPVGISCQVFKQLVYFGLASQQNIHDLHAHQLSQNLQWADSSSKLYTCTVGCFINYTLQKKKDAIPVRTPHGCI